MNEFSENARRVSELIADKYDTIIPIDSFTPSDAEYCINWLERDPQAILELGVGTGRVLSRVRDLIGERLGYVPYCIGVDCSKSIAEVARRRLGAQCDVLVGDVCEANFESKFDLILAVGNIVSMLGSWDRIISMAQVIETCIQVNGVLVCEFLSEEYTDLLPVRPARSGSFTQYQEDGAGLLQFSSKYDDFNLEFESYWFEGSSFTRFLEIGMVVDADRFVDLMHSRGFSLLDRTAWFSDQFAEFSNSVVLTFKFDG